MFNTHVALFNLVGEKKISNVECARSLAGTALELFSRRIVDLLSWNKMFCLIS